MDNYDLVPSGLIKLIKQGFNEGMDHSGTSIGQPTSFFVGAALNLCPPDLEREIKNLHRKVMAGADFFLTQPLYRPEDGERVLASYEMKYGKMDKPVLVGILPLVSIKHANFLHNEVPGISIPDEIRERIEAAGDAERGVRAGVEIAVELAEQAKAWARGVYVMPQFHRYDMTAEIIEEIKRKI
jgi:homocysteine S-methyltransferase